jgi:hypothetical protein
MLAKANRQQAMPPAWEEAYGGTWFVIDESNNIIGRLNKRVFDLDKEELEVVFLMLFNSLSDIISAAYTLSSGWIRPSITALRGALETIATAMTIHHDPEKMARFMSGKLRIPDEVIRPAKQYLPDIGRLYGVLSSPWSHETFDSTSRSIHRDLSMLLLVPNIDSDWMKVYLNTFVEAAVLAQMVGVGLETCFPMLAGSEVHFAADSNGTRSQVRAASHEAIEIMIKARDSVQ